MDIWRYDIMEDGGYMEDIWRDDIMEDIWRDDIMER